MSMLTTDTIRENELRARHDIDATVEHVGRGRVQVTFRSLDDLQHLIDSPVTVENEVAAEHAYNAGHDDGVRAAKAEAAEAHELFVERLHELAGTPVPEAVGE